MMKKLIFGLLTACLMVSMLTVAVSAEEAEAGDGEPYKMFVVMRQAGDAYWETIGGGAVAYGEEHGVDIKLVSPTDYDAAQQVAVIQDCITQNPDAILCCPVSNEACEPVFKQARDQGIVVIATEGIGMQNVDWDVEVIPNQTYGEMWMDTLAEAMGEKGDYVAMVGSLQNTGQMARINFAIDYQKEKYPEMNLVSDIVEPQNHTADGDLALFKELLATYPDATGILAHESLAQAALAIEESGKAGKCWTSGYALPSEVHQYIEDGTVVASVIADIPSSGAALTAIALKVLNGEPIEEGMNLEGVIGFDACHVYEDDKMVEANGVLIVDKDNHTEFDY